MLSYCIDSRCLYVRKHVGAISQCIKQNKIFDRSKLFFYPDSDNLSVEKIIKYQ